MKHENKNGSGNSLNNHIGSGDDNIIKVDKKEIEDLFKRVKELEEEVMAKVDTNIFDHEITDLRDILDKMKSGFDSADSQDTKKIKDLLENFP